jgi:hypothetical protein
MLSGQHHPMIPEADRRCVGEQVVPPAAPSTDALTGPQLGGPYLVFGTARQRWQSIGGHATRRA